VRSKADKSQLNLPHGTNYENVENRKKLKSKKTDMLHWKSVESVQIPEEEKGGYDVI